MATPPDSPGPEEAFFEFESTRARQQTTRPVPIEELLRQTKFSRQEIRVMYRGFKQVCPSWPIRFSVGDFSNRHTWNYARRKSMYTVTFNFYHTFVVICKWALSHLLYRYQFNQASIYFHHFTVYKNFSLAYEDFLQFARLFIWHLHNFAFLIYDWKSNLLSNLKSKNLKGRERLPNDNLFIIFIYLFKKLSILTLYFFYYLSLSILEPLI